MGRAKEKYFDKESGQVMPLAVFLIIPLLIIAAFAVDLGSFYHRASQLQSASDITSLAGAELRSQGASETEVRAMVDTVLEDNGIDTASVAVTVTFSGDEVQVSLNDTDVPVYLSSFFMNDVEITRNATAVKGTCDVDCDQPIVVSPPISIFPTQGDGDGTVPQFVTAANGNEYVFTLKHHQASNQENAITGNPQVPQLLCVDLNTEPIEFCTGFPRRVNTATNDMTRIVWSEATNEIWYLIQRPTYPNAIVDPVARRAGATTYLGLGCVNLDSLADCGTMDIGSVPYGPPIIEGIKDSGHMATQPYEKDGKIYVIDHNMTVHCKEPATGLDCSGYPVAPGGYWDGLRATDVVGNEPGTNPAFTDPAAPSWFRNGGYQPLALISGDNRLYGSWPTINGSFSFCFDLDLAVQSACSGFASSKLVGFPGAFGPGLFEDSDGTGNPDGFCAINWSHDLACVKADGSSRDRSAMNAWMSDPLDRAWTEPFRFGSKVFIGAPDDMLPPQTKNGSAASDAKTYCYDLVANSPCSGGDLGSGIRQDPQPYGYSQLGTRNCLITLGHIGKFATFAPDTLEACPSGDGTIQVFPCGCGDGTYFWGEVAFGTDFLANFATFEVTVEDPAGNQLIGATDLIAKGGRLDLSDLDADLPSIFIKYESDISPGVIQNGPIAGSFSLTERATLIN